ncbi:MAG: phage head closure protein [Vicinamibacterales bacterium]
MNLGDINETVVILHPTVTGQDAVGGDVVTWATLDSWPVNVQELTGAEALGVTGAATNVNAYLVTGRARTDIDTTMRLRRGDSLLEIASVPPNPRSMWTACRCREVPRGQA